MREISCLQSHRRPATTAQRAQLVALLILLTCLSQFYRVSNSVIAPELSRDLGLTATHLGWAGGVFFLALLVMQIPVGLMFDRIGARRTVSGLSIVAVFGAVLLARAEGPASHLIARGIVGIGCAASFMSAVFLVSRWFPPARLSQVAELGVCRQQRRHVDRGDAVGLGQRDDRLAQWLSGPRCA